MPTKGKFVLASASPRRRELVKLGGWEFKTLPTAVDETPQPGEAPQDYVLRIAKSKARAASAETEPDAIIVSADTTVAHAGQILGKPANPQEATQMLQALRGRAHLVYTALAVMRSGTETLLTDLAVTEVPMRDYGDDEIEAYIASGDPFDKAGGYAIQHRGFQPVESLAGCFANVVGLPLCHLVRTLGKMGLNSSRQVPENCQKALEYRCPVYDRILQGEL